MAAWGRRARARQPVPPPAPRVLAPLEVHDTPVREGLDPSGRYRVGTEDGDYFIQCTTCGRRSFNLGDVTNRYCGYCHVFHTDEAEKAELGLSPAPRE